MKKVSVLMNGLKFVWKNRRKVRQRWRMNLIQFYRIFLLLCSSFSSRSSSSLGWFWRRWSRHCGCSGTKKKKKKKCIGEKISLEYSDKMKTYFLALVDFRVGEDPSSSPASDSSLLTADALVALPRVGLVGTTSWSPSCSGSAAAAAASTISASTTATASSVSATAAAAAALAPLVGRLGWLTSSLRSCFLTRTGTGVECLMTASDCSCSPSCSMTTLPSSMTESPVRTTMVWLLDFLTRWMDWFDCCEWK